MSLREAEGREHGALTDGVGRSTLRLLSGQAGRRDGGATLWIRPGPKRKQSAQHGCSIAEIEKKSAEGRGLRASESGWFDGTDANDTGVRVENTDYFHVLVYKLSSLLLVVELVGRPVCGIRKNEPVPGLHDLSGERFRFRWSIRSVRWRGWLLLSCRILVRSGGTLC